MSSIQRESYCSLQLGQQVRPDKGSSILEGREAVLQLGLPDCTGQGFQGRKDFFGGSPEIPILSVSEEAFANFEFSMEYVTPMSIRKSMSSFPSHFHLGLCMGNTDRTT